jgi:hypothetical protein
MDLLKKIEKRRARETTNAVFTQVTSIALMYLAIGASAAVAICGFIDQIDRHIIGALALVPGFAGLLATTLKFDERSQWHYEKRDALDALARRYQFEIPQPPIPDQTAVISVALTKMNEEFNEIWYKNIPPLNWSWTRGIHKGKI